MTKTNGARCFPEINHHEDRARRRNHVATDFVAACGNVWPPWGHVGAILVQLGAILGQLEPSWTILGPLGLTKLTRT